MKSILQLTSNELRQAVSIKEKIEQLQAQLGELIGGGQVPSPDSAKVPGRRRMSAAGRARIAAAARARWARVRGENAPVGKKRRKWNAAAKAKMAAFAKARWAKVKAAGKTAL